MNIIIRQEQHFDFSGISQLNQEAFGRTDESDLIRRLRREEAYVPALSLVAEQESLLVGHIMFSKILIGGVDVGAVALAPMAVLPQFQKNGIGSQLVNRGITLAKKQGYQAIVVLGHPGYYPKFGFIRASSKGIVCPYIDVPDEAFMVLELKDGALNGIRGVVTYSPAFETVN